MIYSFICDVLHRHASSNMHVVTVHTEQDCQAGESSGGVATQGIVHTIGWQ